MLKKGGKTTVTLNTEYVPGRKGDIYFNRIEFDSNSLNPAEKWVDLLPHETSEIYKTLKAIATGEVVEPKHEYGQMLRFHTKKVAPESASALESASAPASALESASAEEKTNLAEADKSIYRTQQPTSDNPVLHGDDIVDVLAQQSIVDPKISTKDGNKRAALWEEADRLNANNQPKPRDNQVMHQLLPLKITNDVVQYNDDFNGKAQYSTDKSSIPDKAVDMVNVLIGLFNARRAIYDNTEKKHKVHISPIKLEISRSTDTVLSTTCPMVEGIETNNATEFVEKILSTLPAEITDVFCKTSYPQNAQGGDNELVETNVVRINMNQRAALDYDAVPRVPVDNIPTLTTLLNEKVNLIAKYSRHIIFAIEPYLYGGVNASIKSVDTDNRVIKPGTQNKDKSIMPQDVYDPPPGLSIPTDTDVENIFNLIGVVYRAFGDGNGDTHYKYMHIQYNQDSSDVVYIDDINGVNSYNVKNTEVLISDNEKNKNKDMWYPELLIYQDDRVTEANKRMFEKMHAPQNNEHVAPSYSDFLQEKTNVLLFTKFYVNLKWNANSCFIDAVIQMLWNNVDLFLLLKEFEHDHSPKDRLIQGGKIQRRILKRNLHMHRRTRKSRGTKKSKGIRKSKRTRKSKGTRKI